MYFVLSNLSFLYKNVMGEKIMYVKYTSSRLITKVKQHWAKFILGCVTNLHCILLGYQS